MSELVVTLTGDEAKLFQAQAKIIKQQIELENGYAGIGESAGKASREAAAAQKKAADEASKVEKIFKDQKNTLELQIIAHKKGNAAATEMKAIQQGLTAEQAARLRGLQQEVEATKKLTEATTGTASSFTGLQDSVLSSMNLGSVAAMASGVGAITAAVGFASKAWRVYQEDQNKALDGILNTSEADRRLVQVSSSPEDLASLQKRADAGAISGGVDRNVARQVLFSARSEGFEKDYESIINASSVVSPESAATVAGKFPSIFGGQIGSLESVSSVLKGALKSNQSFEQIASALPAAAEGAAILKSSPEETIAAQAVISSRFKSGDVAADRIKAFATTAGIDERFAGKGIIKAVEGIDALPDEERKDYLGKSSELNTAYLVLREELPKIKAIEAELAAERKAFASGGGMLRDQTKLARSNPTVLARQEVISERVRADIAKENNLGSSAVSADKAASLVDSIGESRQMGMGERLVQSTMKSIGVPSMLTGMGFDSKGAAMVTNQLTEYAMGGTGARSVGAAYGLEMQRNPSAVQAVVVPRQAADSPATQEEMLAALKKQNELMERQNKLLENRDQGTNNPSQAQIQRQSQMGVEQGKQSQ